MALRFRKSIKLAPGVRWNISGGGSSFSFGPRGASVSAGKRGTYFNAGIPGTGLSARSRIERPAPTPRAAPTLTRVSVTCSVEDDGSLRFVDGEGNPLPDRWVEVAKTQQREALMGLIQTACDKVNDDVEALGRVHLTTPDPRAMPARVAVPFDQSPPTAPAEDKVGFLAGLFASRRKAVESANRAAKDAHERDLAAWQQRKADHEAEQARRQLMLDRVKQSDAPAMESYLEERLRAIEWPRETEVAFEIEGNRVALDVDLPEVEDMPSKVAAVPARGLKLSVKEMSATKVQKLYLNHVHGVLFRLVGEAFAALPSIATVTASGYSQRADPATGHMRDDYLVSVRVSRAQWQALDFTNLAAVDVFEALGALGAVRNVQRSGKLLAVQPLGV